MKCIACEDNDADFICGKALHGLCKECIVVPVQNCVSENKLLKCFGKCESSFPLFEDISDAEKKQFLGSKLLDSYNEIVLSIQLKNLDFLKSCPFCPNRAISDNEEAFHCSNCKRISCLKCKKEFHDGVCAEHTDDEKATEDLVIKCCGVPFIRGDACNKVTCPYCDKKFCWICKSEIYDYSHFSDRVGGCNQWGERPNKLPVVTKPDQPTIKQCRAYTRQSNFKIRCTLWTKGEQFCTNHAKMYARVNPGIRNLMQFQNPY